jgi:hypothetical protein
VNEHNDSIKVAFQKRLEEAARAAKKDVNYYPGYFWEMLREHGGVRTAQLLLEKKKVSEGFVKLWLTERPDLTVESIILEPEWHELFTDAERQIARRRLKEGQ